MVCYVNDCRTTATLKLHKTTSQNLASQPFFAVMTECSDIFHVNYHASTMACDRPPSDGKLSILKPIVLSICADALEHVQQTGSQDDVFAEKAQHQKHGRMRPRRAEVARLYLEEVYPSTKKTGQPHIFFEHFQKCCIFELDNVSDRMHPIPMAGDWNVAGTSKTVVWARSKYFHRNYHL